MPPAIASLPEPAVIAARPAGSPDEPAYPIIAFCHLAWDGVWQRPQQLLSRFAARHPVLLVETYRSEVASSEARARVPAGHPHVKVLAMHLPAARWEDGDFIDAERRRLLSDYLRKTGGRYDRPVLWFNDPMAVTAFAGQCGERAIVYDCMDELTQFRGAPARLGERERRLLALADVVFCGGRKMRDKRLPLNPNCHFYGTGVDAEHFGRALDPLLPVDPAIAALERPVLGYFGVIDERIDYDLLARLADALPHASVAMVGPFAKVDPGALPRRHNLHWLGPRAYAQLPAVTRGFAVCLMPFALNAATEFINPTKALEYLAAGRPVVSTALDEVTAGFKGICHIALTPEEFIARCREQATAPDRQRIRRGRERAADSSWESIVEKMSGHIAHALAARAAPGVRQPPAAHV